MYNYISFSLKEKLTQIDKLIASLSSNGVLKSTQSQKKWALFYFIILKSNRIGDTIESVILCLKLYFGKFWTSIKISGKIVCLRETMKTASAVRPPPLAAVAAV